MTIRIERVDFGPGLSALQEEWNSLLQRSTRPTVYSTFDYVYTSYCHFRTDEEVFALLCRDDSNGRLLALFPLSVWVEPWQGVTLRAVRPAILTKVCDVDKPHPIIDRQYEEACWERLAAYFQTEFRDWDVIVLDEQFAEGNKGIRLGNHFRSPFYHTHVKPGPDSPIVALDGSWDEFAKAHSNMRSKDRRMQKRIGERLRFVVTGDPAHVDRCLDEYIATERMGWKAGKGVSGERGLKFYRDLLPKLAAKGQVYFGTLYDGDAVISAEISYVFKDRVYFALGTYNPDYEKLSPGTVSTSRFIRYFYGKGYVEGDFLAGFAHYVEPWAHRIEKTVDITIHRMGWRTGFLAVRQLLGRRER